MRHKPLRLVNKNLAVWLICFLLPVILLFSSSLITPGLLIGYYLVISILIIYYFTQYSRKVRRLKFTLEQLQEEANVVDNEYSNTLRAKDSFQEKILSYDSLKNIVETINKSLDLNSLADEVLASAFYLISQNKGNCLLYLVDINSQKLVLYKAKKEDSSLVIKEKEGDIFDLWVLKRGSPLLVEDTRKDFRFDPEKIRLSDTRPFFSLVSVPLIADHKVLGVLRLDCPQVNFFTQDDLRFLAKISDLAAVGIDNAQLFNSTQELAIHDGLTAAFTKGYFLERLQDEVKKGLRKKESFSLIMLDIDHFKKYNDKFGHTAGDIVLRSLTETMSLFFKDKPVLISRFGGEEFCLALSGLEKKEACALAEALRKRVEETKFRLRKQETSITVSIGISGFPKDGADELELLMKADRALYKAKEAGRNRVVCV